MFDQYRACVLRTYENMRAANQLPDKLKFPTTKKIKAACLESCARYQRRDEKALGDFFGYQADIGAYQARIESCDNDKFKSIYQLLRGEIKKTEEKNIELLAWLIEFEQRPHEIGREYPLPPKFEPKDNMAPPEETPVASPEKVSVWKYLVLAAACLIALTAGGFYWYNSSPAIPETEPTLQVPRDLAKAGDRCMYWHEDHFETSTWGQVPTGVTAYRLDSADLRHFKKVTRLDTLTPWCVKKLWYFQGRNGIECFTAPGFHPLLPERRLLLLSATVYEHQILPRQIQH